MKRSHKPVYVVLTVALVLLVAVVVMEIVMSRSSSGSVTMESPNETPVISEADPIPAIPESEKPTEAPTEAPTEPVTEAPTEPETEAPTEPEPEKQWQLVLVNKDNPIDPADLPEELTTLRNDVQVDDRVYPDLQEMFDDAREQGIFPLATEGFRTAERQQEIMDSYIASYMAQGYGEEGAKEMALSVVAVPGTSEHELGLALDINAAEGTNESVYAWLAENAWKYGFILRYPEGKEAITGISFEPWHYRYVGRAAAAEIHESGETLEEYVARICEN